MVLVVVLWLCCLLIMSVMGVPHGDILAQLPNQIDLLINVDRHRGQYKMKVENDDTVESIVAKAMKGV